MTDNPGRPRGAVPDLETNDEGEGPMAQTEDTVEAGAAHSATPAAAAPGGGTRKRVVLTVVAVALVALALWGFRKWQWSRTHVTTDNAQVEGHITPVLARTGGYVNKVLVQDNQQVKAGDVLVVLDDRDLQARLAQADAELNALLSVAGGEGRAGQAAAQIGGAQAQASASQAQVAQAQAQVASAQAAARKANSDLERIRTLAARNIVSQQQLDAATAAAEAANSSVSAAQAQVTAAQRNASAASQQVAVAQAGLQGADARVAAARAARDQVALQLSYTRVVAPADGVVSKRTVEAGQLVQPGQPLMTVVPLTDVWVVANFKETEVRTVVPGEDVEFEVDAYPGRTFHGKVESLSPATGAKFSLLPPDNSTGNYTKVVQRIPVKVRVTGGTDAAHPLRPGMSAEVVVDIPSS